jgi:TRAP-type mannitol/chloroaromatic compound transport system permease small subunit
MRLARAYIQYMDRLNWVIGRCTMYGIFLLMGVLFYSSISKTFFVPSLWTLEMAQFVMVGYYVLGGPYSLQLGSNVRMDLLYGNWPQRKKILV